MNILFATFYFPPEVGAPQRRIWETALGLKKKGHSVQILTGFPNYPRGEIIPPYQRRLYQRENMDGIEVLRVWHGVSGRKGKWGRAFSEGSFAFAAILASLLEQAPEVVVVESPSLLLGWVGMVLKRMRRTSFVLHIADPVLVAAVGTGMMEKGLLFSALSKMENWFYRIADRIVTVSPGICRILYNQGVPASKVMEIPNGVENSVLEHFQRMDFGFNGQPAEIKAVYAGNHGKAQNLTTVLEAAAQLSGREPVHFYLYGDGIEKGELLRRAKGLNLSNLEFFEPVPADQMIKILAKADVWLVPLADRAELEWAIPSKLLEGMAAGKPVILSARGESAKLLRQAQAGLVVEPDNPKALAEAICRIRENPDEGKRMGENGREFVRQNFLRSVLVDKLEKLLVEVAEEKRRIE